MKKTKKLQSDRGTKAQRDEAGSMDNGKLKIDNGGGKKGTARPGGPRTVNEKRRYFAEKVKENERLSIIRNLITAELDPKKLAQARELIKKAALPKFNSKNSKQPSAKFPLYTDIYSKSAMTQYVQRLWKEAAAQANREPHLKVCEAGRQIGKSLQAAQQGEKTFSSFLQDRRNNKCKSEERCELRENNSSPCRFSSSSEIHVCPLLECFQNSMDKVISELILGTPSQMIPKSPYKSSCLKTGKNIHAKAVNTNKNRSCK